MIIRTGTVLAFIVAAAVLAYQIGSRLSDQAIMTIVGVLCGIVATIPITIGLLIALTRERAAYLPADDEYLDPVPAPASYNVYRPAAPTPPPLPQQPQIIVVAPPQSQLPPNLASYPNYLLPPQTNSSPASMQERNFKIVGEDDGE